MILRGLAINPSSKHSLQYVHRDKDGDGVDTHGLVPYVVEGGY